MNGAKPASEDLTGLLRAWSGGDDSALTALTPIVYAELHRLAQKQMQLERGGHLLQPTALVNEAFIRLIGGNSPAWDNRRHFYAISSRLMRQILVDFARTAEAQKRGNRSPHQDLATIEDSPAGKSMLSAEDLISLDAALDRLELLDDRQAKVVTLRYFGGLDNREIALTLGISEPTVARDWRQARAWLYSTLTTAS